MQYLTREQAELKAQELADETQQPHIIVQDGKQYQVISALDDVDVIISDTVDCKWPMEA